MIDLEKYFNEQFQPMDILGVTSFGVLPRIIWRNTWVRKNPLAFFTGCFYRGRAHLSTHTAITYVDKYGYPFIVEMDTTIPRRRYVAKAFESILLPEEYEMVKHSCADQYDEVFVYSGLKVTNPWKYFTENFRDPHVCWIGRYRNITPQCRQNGNAWLSKKIREGVPYDYIDVINQWELTKHWKIYGSGNVYICSELPQRCFEHLGILQKQRKPMTPMDWQKSKFMKGVKV